MLDLNVSIILGRRLEYWTFPTMKSSIFGLNFYYTIEIIKIRMLVLNIPIYKFDHKNVDTKQSIQYNNLSYQTTII